LLQKINQQIFKKPEDIMDNLRLLDEYFKDHYPDYLFVAPLQTNAGMNYVKLENDYYRMFPFIENACSFDTVSNLSLAFEAARQFGEFTALLSAFDPAHLHITLPDFHNLSLRLRQFNDSLNQGNKKRIEQTGESIRFLKDQQAIAGEFELIKTNPDFTLRVVHHDAKINNVLFDKRNNRGLCVIDLDTVMPGYYISDVGDMLRTYLCPVSEEEHDFQKIHIREEYFREIAKGYFSEMQQKLSESEKLHFVYAGKFAIYMQALRFLTDYINNDIYYSIKYSEHNLVRAKNQIALLKKYLEKEELLNSILNVCL
ncbi:MAG TPA: aminoglycoside phosphotransferase family protein, partial [Puia sp.]|nr:aminoglycoside phosphotransferase family protein [Puia sp.]